MWLSGTMLNAGSPVKVSKPYTYDKLKFYEATTERGVDRVAVRPRKVAKIGQHANSNKPPLLRDENLRAIRKGAKKVEARVELSPIFSGRNCGLSLQDHLRKYHEHSHPLTPSHRSTNENRYAGS